MSVSTSVFGWVRVMEVGHQSTFHFGRVYNPTRDDSEGSSPTPIVGVRDLRSD